MHARHGFELRKSSRQIIHDKPEVMPASRRAVLRRRDKLDAAIEPDHRELAVLFLPPRLAHAEHVLKQLHRSFHIRYRHGSMVKIRFHFFAPFDFTTISSFCTSYAHASRSRHSSQSGRFVQMPLSDKGSCGNPSVLLDKFCDRFDVPRGYEMDMAEIRFTGTWRAIVIAPLRQVYVSSALL